MGNYFNELRWKIIRANNLFQFIHQVTIEFRFRKSLAQERFKSNLELAGSMENGWVLSYQFSAKGILRSDWADANAYLNFL